MHPGIAGIRSRLTLPFREGEPLARWTTFGVGGPADLWVEPRNFSELSRLLELADTEGLPWVVLGRGANILAADEGFRGIVIHLSGDFRRIVLRPPFLFAGAGAALGRAVWLGMEAGLGGWEKLLAVPSSVGGALLMNAGCYGQEICEVLDWVLLMDARGRTRRLPARELSFGYRSSPLRGRGVVCWAGFKLAPGAFADLRRVARAIVHKRHANLPPGKSAGSVFKNPPGRKARELIACCGLGGTVSGGAKISDRHPNFILNMGTSTAADIAALIRLAKTRVWEAQGVRLEEEVRFVGFGPSTDAGPP